MGLRELTSTSSHLLNGKDYKKVDTGGTLPEPCFDHPDLAEKSIRGGIRPLVLVQVPAEQLSNTDTMEVLMVCHTSCAMACLK